jgi:hypothetical protein
MEPSFVVSTIGPISSIYAPTRVRGSDTETTLGGQGRRAESGPQRDPVSWDLSAFQATSAPGFSCTNAIGRGGGERREEARLKARVDDPCNAGRASGHDQRRSGFAEWGSYVSVCSSCPQLGHLRERIEECPCKRTKPLVRDVRRISGWSSSLLWPLLDVSAPIDCPKRRAYVLKRRCR